MQKEPQASPRSDDLRLRLLEAAIAVFGRHGFDGASTRMLASAAGVNLQAIPYHFGGKEGLYLAAADHIGMKIQTHVGPAAMKVRTRLAVQPAGTPLPAEEARRLLAEMLESAARLMVGEESAAFARFVVTEQMEPTAAFERLYAKVMSPLLETARRLVGALIGADPESETVRLRTIATLGQILVLRVAHAAVMRQLQWSAVGTDEFAAIKAMIDEIVASLRRPAKAGGVA